MPPGSRADDKYFGGTPGAAARAWDSMRRNYKTRDAEHVYYGSIAKKRRKHKRGWLRG